MRSSLGILLAVALAAVIWTADLYAPRAPHFPRDAGAFRPAAERDLVLAAAQAAVQADPEDVDAWTELAIARYELGPDHALESLEALEKARDLGALDDRLFYYAGVMYEAAGLPDYARADYARFLRRHPEDDEVRLRLANLSARLGDLERAEKLYRALLDRTQDPIVTFNLALVHRDQKRFQDGLDLLNGLVERGRALPPGGVKLLGDLHRGAGDAKTALAHYLRALAEDKGDTELAAAVASACEETGDLAQALAQYRRLSTLDPKNRKARERIRVLERKQKAAERAARRR